MADDKTPDQQTEEPTPRRLERALEEGQIAFSSELTSGLMLVVGVIFFFAMGAWFFAGLKNVLRQRLSQFDPMLGHPENILICIRQHLAETGNLCLAILIPVVMIILTASFLQTRFNISTKPLEWNWNKMDPFKGWKRIVSLRSVNRGGVAIVKATLIVFVTYWLTISQLGEITATSLTTLEYAVHVGTRLILSIGLVTAMLMSIVGAFDYGFQWWKQRQEMRMTLQEVRDEHKETEGDPQIKARIRRIASEVNKKRMTTTVPKATVVVTNPTHFAVALRYAPEEGPAPIVVAKGADFLAMQIIKIAKDNGVAIVERKPVARYLYSNVKLGQPIPMEMFQAVAEIINFIRQIENRAA